MMLVIEQVLTLDELANIRRLINVAKWEPGRETAGAQAALPIWIEIARRILPEQATLFAQPPGVATRSIDPKTGQLATSQCPEQISEVFIEGTEPSVYCELHGGGIWERLRQTFGF